MINISNDFYKISNTTEQLLSKLRSATFEELQQTYTYFYAISPTLSGEVEKRISMLGKLKVTAYNEKGKEIPEVNNKLMTPRFKDIINMMNRAVFNGVSFVQVITENNDIKSSQMLYPDDINYDTHTDSFRYRQHQLSTDETVYITKRGYGRVQEAGLAYTSAHIVASIHFLQKQYMRYVETVASPTVLVNDRSCTNSKDPERCRQQLLSKLARGFRTGFILDERINNPDDTKPLASYLEAKGDMSGIKDMIDMLDRTLIAHISGGDILNRGSSGGSRALGDVQQDIFLRMVLQDSTSVAATLSKLLTNMYGAVITVGFSSE